MGALLAALLSLGAYWRNIHHHSRESIPEKTLGYLALTCFMNAPQTSPDGFALKRTNYQWMIIGILILIVGYLLMSGGAAEDPTAFSEEIFSTRRITIAPIVVLLGTEPSFMPF